MFYLNEKKKNKKLKNIKYNKCLLSQNDGVGGG